jgi:hypothetical protein
MDLADQSISRFQMPSTQLFNGFRRVLSQSEQYLPALVAFLAAHRLLVDP